MAVANSAVLGALGGLNTGPAQPFGFNTTNVSPEDLQAMRELGKSQLSTDLQPAAKGTMSWLQALAHVAGVEAGRENFNAASNIGKNQKERSATTASDTLSNFVPGSENSGSGGDFDLDAYVARQAQLESGGDNSNVTGSNYGRQQFSKDQWAKYGINDKNWQDPAVQDRAAKMEAQDNIKAFSAKYGRAPSPGELYLMHQQGPSGAFAHFDNPQGYANKNIEKYYPNPEVAGKAILGNIGKDAGFNSMPTSGQFVNYWNNKFNAGMPKTAKAAAPASAPQVAAAPVPGPNSVPGTTIVGGPQLAGGGGGPSDGGGGADMPSDPYNSAPRGPVTGQPPAPLSVPPQASEAPIRVAQAAQPNGPVTDARTGVNVIPARPPLNANPQVLQKILGDFGTSPEVQKQIMDLVIGNQSPASIKAGAGNIQVTPQGQTAYQPGAPTTEHIGEVPFSVSPDIQGGQAFNRFQTPSFTSTPNAGTSNSNGGGGPQSSLGPQVPSIMKEYAAAKANADTTASNIKDYNKERAQELNTDVAAGREAPTQLRMYNQLEQLTDTEGYKQLVKGQLSQPALEMSKSIESILGIHPVEGKQAIAVGDMVNKINNDLGSQGARELTNRPTQFDYVTKLQSAEGLFNSPQGMKMMLDAAKQTAQIKQELAIAAQEYRDKPEEWNAKRAEIIKNNPVILHYEGKPLTDWVKENRPNAMKTPGGGIQNEDGSYTYNNGKVTIRPR